MVDVPRLRSIKVNTRPFVEVLVPSACEFPERLTGTLNKSVRFRLIEATTNRGAIARDDLSGYCSIASNGWGKMPKIIIPIPRRAIRNLLKAGTAIVGAPSGAGCQYIARTTFR